MTQDNVSRVAYGDLVAKRERTPLGRLIYEARQRKGWVQEELEAQSGISRSTIVRWEHGRTEPKPPELIAVADALGIDREVAFRAAGWLAEAEEYDGKHERRNGPPDRRSDAGPMDFEAAAKTIRDNPRLTTRDKALLLRNLRRIERDYGAVRGDWDELVEDIPGA